MSCCEGYLLGGAGRGGEVKGVVGSHPVKPLLYCVVCLDGVTTLKARRVDRRRSRKGSSYLGGDESALQGGGAQFGGWEVVKGGNCVRWIRKP